MDNHPLASDLNFILEHTAPLWQELQHQTIFITGGTGFFGTWLLESLAWANDKLNLQCTATVLTRSPQVFAKKSPHLFHHPALHFYEGDVRNFIFPEKKYAYIIHAATEASVALNEDNPILMFDTIVEGTKRILEFSRHCNAKKILFASSGAVYGRQPAHLSHLDEDYHSNHMAYDANSAYAIGKYAAEHLCCLYAKQYGLDIKIARCFAFVGPHLPLDIHFAIGNFIRDALKGGPIRIAGDGTPCRSYLYAADLVIWLWTILFKGVALRPYNVGSDEVVSIAEVAQLVADSIEKEVTIHIGKQPNPDRLPERYVPCIKRAREELGLKPRINLIDAVKSTLQWNKIINDKQLS